MAWVAGVTRITGDLVSAGDWNGYLGAGGDLDILFDGTKILSALVRESSMDITSPPIDQAKLVADSSGAGGLEWLGTWEDPDYWLSD